MSNVEITGANSGSWGRRPAYLLSGYNVKRGQRTDSSLQSQKLNPSRTQCSLAWSSVDWGPGLVRRL
jgi:hypothetical protein